VALPRGRDPSRTARLTSPDFPPGQGQPAAPIQRDQSLRGRSSARELPVAADWRAS